MEILNKKIIVYLIFISIVSTVLLYNLDLLPMQLWDESRQANNALEMMQSGNYLYPTFDHQPDFWNTKPHLLIVIQALFFKVTGPGLMALRLPSALAGILTMFIWFQFFYSRNKKAEALIFSFILLTCSGFNVYHITRTGDYDALLLLFISLCLITFHSIVFEGFTKRKTRWFYVFFGLAFLTKSVAALLWVPVYFILFLIYKKHKNITFKQILSGIWIPVLMILFYYGYREIVTPGYISAVWENEIAVRYFSPNEGHESEWYYYFTEIYNHYFYGYWILFLLSIILLFIKNSGGKKNIAYFGISTLLFLILLSSSKTRIHWYMAPVIPCMAGVVALSIPEVVRIIKLKYLKIIAGSILVISILIIGILNWKQLWLENNNWGGLQPQEIFRNAEKTGKFPHQGTFMLGTYNPLENYYAQIFKRKNIPFKTSYTFNFKSGDTVFLYRWDHMDSMKKYNQCRQIHSPDHEIPVWVYAVDSGYLKRN